MMMTGSADAHSAFRNMQAKTANPRLLGRVTGAFFRVAKDTELVASEYSRLRIGRQGGARWACQVGQFLLLIDIRNPRVQASLATSLLTFV